MRRRVVFELVHGHLLQFRQGDVDRVRRAEATHDRQPDRTDLRDSQHGFTGLSQRNYVLWMYRSQHQNEDVHGQAIKTQIHGARPDVRTARVLSR